MAKFRLNPASVFTIGGNAIACVTEVTIDEAADDYMSNCSGQTFRTHVDGMVNVTGSANFEIETDDVTELGYIEPGDNGALVLRPAGITAGMINIASTNLIVLSRSVTFSSTGLATGSFTFVCDDLAITAIAP
jgi:hypothetical protein